MQQTILGRIVSDKAVWLQAHQKRLPLSDFQPFLVPSGRNFYEALSGNQTHFILECKKASPSKGIIRDDFDPARIAAIYSNFASVISVLTDEKYFQGSFDFLSQVSAAAHQPVLCKDFFIDPYQIYLARYYKADAILLMLSVLDDCQYRQLAAVAHSLNMGILTEVSNEAELMRAIALKAQVVGINNRDLRDLSVDLNRTRKLAPRLPENVTIISESGINHHAQVRELSQYANGFLIGSALMAEHNLTLALHRLLLGDNKVCGLTRPEDATAASQAGAIYGGLIFVKDSPRLVSEHQAREIINTTDLRYVGVFRNAIISDIVTYAVRLSLSAIQLHGQEDQSTITALRKALPQSVQIWKALSVDVRLPSMTWSDVDRYLLDNGPGGTGAQFDWSLLSGVNLTNTMLAGGLNAENCVQAAQFGCAGLDFNSGVETTPGCKDATKIANVFRLLRAY